MILDWVGPLLLVEREIRRIPTGVPGVYLLHTLSLVAGGYRTYYAGQSTDLRRRLCEHTSSSRTKWSLAAVYETESTYFSAAPVLIAADRLRAEAGLIAILRPPLNVQHPSAPAVLVTLPPMRFI